MRAQRDAAHASGATAGEPPLDACVLDDPAELLKAAFPGRLRETAELVEHGLGAGGITPGHLLDILCRFRVLLDIAAAVVDVIARLQDRLVLWVEAGDAVDDAVGGFLEGDVQGGFCSLAAQGYCLTDRLLSLDNIALQTGEDNDDRQSDSSRQRHQIVPLRTILADELIESCCRGLNRFIRGKGYREQELAPSHQESENSYGDQAGLNQRQYDSPEGTKLITAVDLGRGFQLGGYSEKERPKHDGSVKVVSAKISAG